MKVFSTRTVSSFICCGAWHGKLLVVSMLNQVKGVVERLEAVPRLRLSKGMTSINHIVQ
jgi:hypothetical protein